MVSMARAKGKGRVHIFPERKKNIFRDINRIISAEIVYAFGYRIQWYCYIESICKISFFHIFVIAWNYIIA